MKTSLWEKTCGLAIGYLVGTAVYDLNQDIATRPHTTVERTAMGEYVKTTTTVTMPKDFEEGSIKDFFNSTSVRYNTYTLGYAIFLGAGAGICAASGMAARNAQRKKTL